jgi:hypothetical protein
MSGVYYKNWLQLNKEQNHYTNRQKTHQKVGIDCDSQRFNLIDGSNNNGTTCST